MSRELSERIQTNTPSHPDLGHVIGDAWSPTARQGQVTVQRGDSYASIARHELSLCFDRPTAAQVLKETQQLQNLNHGEVLHPGMEIRAW